MARIILCFPASGGKAVVYADGRPLEVEVACESGRVVVEVGSRGTLFGVPVDVGSDREVDRAGDHPKDR